MELARDRSKARESSECEVVAGRTCRGSQAGPRSPPSGGEGSRTPKGSRALLTGWAVLSWKGCSRKPGPQPLAAAWTRWPLPGWRV